VARAHVIFGQAVIQFITLHEAAHRRRLAEKRGVAATPVIVELFRVETGPAADEFEELDHG
jgi:hypothetical protein